MAVQSFDPEAKYLPLGSTDMDQILSECPSRDIISFPF